MKSTSALLIIFLCMIVPGLSRASLAWDSMEISQTAGLGEKSVRAIFKFKNTGVTPVEIKETVSSCGCTTVQLAKKIYATGETGQIEAVLDIGDRQGLQVKTIKIITDGAGDPVVLTMKTLIPRVLEIKPAFVYWKRGEVPNSIKVMLAVDTEEPVNIVGVASSNLNMQAQIEVLIPGKSYALEVFPLSTDESFKAVISLKTDYPAKNPRTFYVHAAIK